MRKSNCSIQGLQRLSNRAITAEDRIEQLEMELVRERAKKGRTRQWNSSTNQTWSSARAQLGIAVDVSPTGTTLTYEQIYTSGPTLQEALLTFLGETLSRYEALRKSPG